MGFSFAAGTTDGKRQSDTVGFELFLPFLESFVAGNFPLNGSFLEV